MPETLAEKAKRLGIQPASQPRPAGTESLAQKAQRLGIKPAANYQVQSPTANIPVLKQLTNFGVGIGSEIGKAGLGLGQTVLKGVGALGSLFGRDTKERFTDPLIKNMETIKQNVYEKPFKQQLNTFSGGAGRVVGATIPYITPSAGITKAQNVVTGGISKIPAATKYGEFGKGVLNVLGRAVPEATTAGAVGYAVSGGDSERAKRDALLAGGASVVLGGLGSAYRGLKNTDVLSGEGIMQRVARISPTKQTKFKDMTGESVGEYLTKRGIYGNEDDIVKQLYERFNTSKQAADDTLAQLKGTHKFEPIKTALDELMGRESRISTPGALSQDLERVSSLRSKYLNEGLTMSEINEVKRLFEKNVKLDYVKSNLTENIAKANNIDSAIRKWQLKQAQTYGVKGFEKLNKETQAARQLADDLWKTYSGKGGNNALSLTDWVLLSGDPTGASIPSFAAKRIFGNKRVQSAIAKQTAGPASVGIPTAIPPEMPRLGTGTSGNKVSLPSTNTINLGPSRPRTNYPPAPTTGQNIIPQTQNLLPEGSLPAGFQSPSPNQINLPARSQSTIDSVMGSSKQLPQQSPRTQSILPSNNNKTISNILKGIDTTKVQVDVKPLSDTVLELSWINAPKQGSKVIPQIEKNAIKEGFKTIQGSIKRDASASKLRDIWSKYGYAIYDDPNLNTIIITKNLPQQISKIEGKATPAILAGAGLAAVGATKLPNYVKELNTDLSNLRPTPKQVEAAPLAVDTLKKEIAHRETGTVPANEKYTAKNKNTNGTYDLGKYQLNNETLKAYGDDLLGRKITEKEFLSNPQLQEEFIAKYYEFMKKEGITDKDLLLAFWHRGWGDRSPERQKTILKEEKTKKYLNNKPSKV